MYRGKKHHFNIRSNQSDSNKQQKANLLKES
jgi:hypothetical protein